MSISSLKFRRLVISNWLHYLSIIPVHNIWYQSQPPPSSLVSHQLQPTKKQKKTKKKEAKQDQIRKPQTTHSIKSPTCQPKIIPLPTCFLLAPALKPQIVPNPTKKKTPHTSTHDSLPKKKKKLKIQFLHQA